MRVLGGIAVVVALALLGGSAWLLRDPRPRFLDRRSSMARAVEGAPEVDERFRLTPVRVEATSGLAVDLAVRRASADSGRTLPLVVILGGHYTGRDAARMLGDTRGVVAAAVSYPFTGDPRPDAATFLRQIPQIRAAFLDTPPALMLALDYLLQLPGIDRSRVELVGVSLGAPFASVAGALDSRFTRVWALHGSGGSYAPLEMSMRRTIGLAPLRAAAAATASVIIAGPRLAPERWVGAIAPRPFVMVNAAGDERLPRASVDALYRSAREPKRIIWMEGGHVHRDAATIQRLVGVVMATVAGPEWGRGRSGVSPESVRSGAGVSPEWGRSHDP
jgi:dienelactone hydrolase